MVRGPYREFALMHANRVVADGTISTAANIIAYERGQSASLRKELTTCNEDKLVIKRQLLEYKEASAQQQIDLIACGEKNARLKSWATIGRITVVLVAIGVGTAAYVVISSQ